MEQMAWMARQDRRANDKVMARAHYVMICSINRMKNRLERIEPFTIAERQQYIQLLQTAAQAAAEIGVKA